MRQKLNTAFPLVADEWDYDKNIGITPNDFSAGSERKVWWKCSEGHSWQAKIYSRTGGCGCPVCGRNRVKQGVNDLVTCFPEIALEWDYENNRKLLPNKFSYASNQKVWWKCKLGHSWEATINKRSSGRNCPYCSGNKVLIGFNDLPTTYPQIAAEWDYRRNGAHRSEQFSAGADVKMWWKCKQGHSWEALIYSRKNCGCPVCAGNILARGINDLMTVNPNTAVEWDYEKNGNLTPDSVAANTSKKAWWRCKRGHSWKSVVSSRNSGKGCPYCNHRKVLSGFNDLLTISPKLVEEWDYERNKDLLPQNVTVSSNKSVWWKCGKGHSWEAKISNRHFGTGCPYCANKSIIIGENDFASQYPKLALQWDLLKNGKLAPQQVTFGSNQKFWWICDKGHSYKSSVSNRTTGKNCPYCAGKIPIVGENDFATIHPELLSEWDCEKNGRAKPTNYTCGSRKKVWWICKRGHSWKTAVCHRHIGTGCPYCEGLLAIPGETDFATTYSELADEWDYDRNFGVDIRTIKPYSNKKFWWVCSQGHHWRSTVGSRNAGANCPFCNGKRPLRTRIV